QPNVKIYSVGLQLNIPFDTNFTTEYQVKEDRALYRQAHAQARQETDTILLEVWQAYAGLKSAMGAYVNAQQQVISAKNALSGIRTEYRIGLANILELITAEQNLIQARTTRASELANYYEYQADLYRYAGLIPDRSR
ncbi:TolC family protein, partial [Acidithiobacillus ferrooxidans]